MDNAMPETLKPDICVIGAGPAGLAVAAAAAAFGAPVVLVEKGRMGGNGLYGGGAPTLALLAAGRRARAIREAAAFGLKPQGEPETDMRAVHDHIQAVIDSIQPDASQERFAALGVRVIRAPGRFVSRRTLEAGEFMVRARRFVIAAGSTAALPPIPGLHTVDFFTSETIFANRRRLAHLVVVGGGSVAVELAQAYRRLGAKVTLVEAQRVLPDEDPELAAFITGALRAEGVAILEGTAIVSAERRGKSGVRLMLRAPDGAESELEASDLLIAAGRLPALDGLGLKNARIAHDEKGIAVNAAMRTSNRRVYAVGDVVGPPLATHLAAHQAGLAVRAILLRRRARRAPVPRVTWTDPELAHVGLSEAAARQRHGDIRILRWPLAENDRAKAERAPEGEIKIVADPTGLILGASIVGAGAGEMIPLWTLALSKGMRLDDIAGIVMPYPSLGEIGRRAAMTHYAPMAARPWVRRLVGFLRRLG